MCDFKNAGAVLVGGRSVLRQIVCVALTMMWVAIAHAGTTGTFLDRDAATDIRLATWNVQGNLIADSSRDAAFDRVLSAINPDIIVLTEIPSNAIESQIGPWLSANLGGTWFIHGGLPTGIRTVVASRFALSMQEIDTIPASSTRGVTMAVADLPNGTYPRDLYIMGVHLKCCGGNDSQDKRQRSADAIASWMGDARLSGGSITLPDDTPMIVLGDFNLVGGSQPTDTLLTGDIIDEGTFGGDIKGDWDISDLTDLTPRDPNTLDADTWPAQSSPSSRLDRFMYTDSVVVVANNFVLNTSTMTSGDLIATGMFSADTTTAQTADHLPIVFDLSFGGGFEDCNNNGVDDADDISSGFSTDCNTNLVPDECDISGGFSNDCNTNDIPDDCETDCNGNRIADECDIASGTSDDLDMDGVPDECQVAANLVINELLADPPGTMSTDLEGDANGDGVRDTFDDEFIEIVNLSGGPLDISDFTISDGTSGGTLDQIRHTFPSGTIVADQCGIIVFGAGNPTGTFGDMLVQTASTGTLSLRNSADTIFVHDQFGNLVAGMSHTGAGSNTSLNLDPEPTGMVYVEHDSIAPGGAAFSAGTRIDGSMFAGCGEVPPDGACCLMDGSCVQEIESSCSSLGGVYQGDGVTCLQANCPQPMGACCLADGSCVMDTAANCGKMAGSVYQGDGSDCASVSCAQPCPWDCVPPGGNGVVNFDDLVATVNAISTQDLDCDVAPDNGDGTYGNGVITFDDLIAVVNNFGACP